MYMTVGDLKKALEGIDDSYEVRYQRIEDIYFEKYGWEPKKLIFDCCGPNHIIFDENGFVIKDENGNCKRTTEHSEDCYSDYIKVFSAYKHSKSNTFVLNGHY